MRTDSNLRSGMGSLEPSPDGADGTLHGGHEVGDDPFFMDGRYEAEAAAHGWREIMGPRQEREREAAAAASTSRFV